MENIFLSPITLEDLKSLITDSVKVALDNRHDYFTKPIEEDPLLSIEQVQVLLSVSKVTIHKWKKKGLITYHKLNRRLYFKRSEVLNALKKVSQKK